MVLDHVIVAVQAPAEGLPRVPGAPDLVPQVGGRHPGWGTTNWIVPLGDAYLELVAIVDEREAPRSHFGRWVSRASEGSVVGWAVRPDDLEATAARLGLDVATGARTRPSGDRVEWRMAGVEQAAERPYLPFFIEWDSPDAFPGRTAGPAPRVVRVRIEADLDELDEWLGPNALPLDMHPGDAGVTAVVLESAGGPVAVEMSRKR